jgi:hypothetical protein
MRRYACHVILSGASCRESVDRTLHFESPWLQPRVMNLSIPATDVEDDWVQNVL